MFKILDYGKLSSTTIYGYAVSGYTIISGLIELSFVAQTNKSRIFCSAILRASSRDVGILYTAEAAGTGGTSRFRTGVCPAFGQVMALLSGRCLSCFRTGDCLALGQVHVLYPAGACRVRDTDQTEKHPLLYHSSGF